MIGRILFISIAVAAFALDRVSKLLVRDGLALGERVQVIGDLLQLHHIRNRGIAFGLLSDAGALVLIGSLVVAALLFVFMMQVSPDDVATRIGGALITGGAIGNVVDRVQHGYVTDFIQLPHWPLFNVADICITAGVGLVLVGQVILNGPAGPQEERP